MSSIVSDCGEATPRYATVFPIPRAATKGCLVKAHRCRPGSNILKIGFSDIKMSKKNVVVILYFEGPQTVYIVQNRTHIVHFVCVKPMYPKLPKSLHNILINKIKIIKLRH